QPQPQPQPQLALKIDVDTLRGTREGVPRLLATLARAQASATFLFSLGPDRTGRAIRRVLRPGFFGKVARTSVLEHYGLKTLLYGTVLPAPDIARRAAASMRAARDAGHEVGVHCFDHTGWQDLLARRDAAWARQQMQSAVARFNDVFGVAPEVHGAAGWQMSEAALLAEEALGFRYASDTRGTTPFVPWIAGRPGRCPQLPTTLPTLDELIGIDGLTAERVHEPLLRASDPSRPQPSHRTRAGPVPACPLHVFTLHAELEGMKLLPALERLLAGWRAQGYALVSLREALGALDTERLPLAPVVSGSVPGRSGTLAVQGAVLSAEAPPTPSRAPR
ncbi:MAG TPA: polysaccharide deacetylase family protein, partial [Steroidobacteraceae bacterium]|nr:polysaccharide deacetylase family protein [Steroidobacteraceae bacterium]